jgi:hypothetical protein
MFPHNTLYKPHGPKGGDIHGGVEANPPVVPAKTKTGIETIKKNRI